MRSHKCRVDGGRVIAKRGESGCRLAVTEDLPTPPLAGCDGEDARLDTGFAERILPALCFERLHGTGQLVLWHGLTSICGTKRDVREARRHVGSDRTVDLIGDGFAQRAIA